MTPPLFRARLNLPAVRCNSREWLYRSVVVLFVPPSGVAITMTATLYAGGPPPALFACTTKGGDGGREPVPGLAPDSRHDEQATANLCGGWHKTRTFGITASRTVTQ